MSLARVRRSGPSRLLALGAVAVLVLGACSDGSGDPDATDSTTTTSTTSAPTTEPTSEATTEPPALTDLVVAPGQVGDARAGMTKDEALATGLFDADVDSGVDGCGSAALAWKEPYASSLDVYTSEEGTIVSIGIRDHQPRTADGLGVGSTLRQISKVYETAELTEAGFGQTGLFVTDGEDWLGFLFDTDVDSIRRMDVVSFVEVTHGTRPDLMRSGC